MPRKLVAQQPVVWAQARWSVRRSRHRKDGVPSLLVAQQGGLGTGKMVRLGSL